MGHEFYFIYLAVVEKGLNQNIEDAGFPFHFLLS